MHGRIKWILILLLALPFGSDRECAFAQDTLDNTLAQKLEVLAERSQNEEEDYTNLLEALAFFRKHPINLNSTSSSQLSDLGMLDDIQTENLLRHIDKNGKLLSIYELQTIDGFSTPTIDKILPYVYVSDATKETPLNLKRILQEGNHDFILRIQQVLEEQKGFLPVDSAGICNNPNSRYIGSPQKIYSRYRFSYGTNVSAGITAEKDAGELFFRNQNRFNYPCYNSLLNGKLRNGFDFYSAHIYIKNIKFIKAINIGDYQIGFGQGLTTWSGLAYGKSSDAINIKRHGTGIRPYTSVDENRFMRGAALTAGSEQLQATAFFSRNKLDANIIYADTTNTVEAYSLQNTGLHSTTSEIADKDAIGQTIVGGNISFKKRKYSLGLTGMHTQFDGFLKSSSQPYAIFGLSGNQLNNAGLDYSLLVQNFNFFGELAVSKVPSLNGPRGVANDEVGFCLLNGCIISLDPKLSIALLYRNYQRNFKGLTSNAFAESSNPVNEQGFYSGITITPSNSISINAYYDHFYFPWLKYQVSAPSQGKEYLVQINYTPKKSFNTYFCIRQKDKFTNSSSVDEIDFLTPYRQTNYRWHLGYKVAPSVKLSNRIEFIQLDKDAKNKIGYLIYQDISYRKIGSKLSFILRYALFDTKSYYTRIYAYENDITGSWSIPSYYKKGSRIYAMLHGNLSSKVEIWFRWSQTYYSNQNVISRETLNEIQGNSKNEVKLQLKYKF